MIVAGLDYETTFTDPIDPRVCRVVETGIVLWDTDRNMPLRMYNRTCWADDYGPFDPRITDLTGLELEDIKTHGDAPQIIHKQTLGLLALADAVVAHNGTNFDKIVHESECARFGLTPTEKPWIDTSVDVPYPQKVQTRKLVHLAAEHGFLNPFAHRALFDVLSMLTVMGKYDAKELLRRATAMKVKLRAVTAKPWEDNGKSNQIAKDRGFRFDGSAKIWTKVVLEDEVERELADKSVTVVRLN